MLLKRDLILFVSCIIIFSCSSESNPIVHFEKYGEIFPLAIGNKWEYIQISYDTDSNSSDSLNKTREISSSYEQNHKVWFSFSASYWDYSIQNEGLWTKHTQSPSEAIPYLSYKYPTYQGDKYSDYEVITVNKIIKINLGHFKTIQYRFSKDIESEGYIDVFLCPGIGLVKYCKIKNNNEGEYFIAMEQELLSYEVK